MNENVNSGEGDTRWQTINFSLTPELAQEVKTEAARRNITLRKLFEELWEDYKNSTGAQ